MLAAVAHLGSATSHGGVITSGSPRTRADGIPVARRGDGHDCPLHGPNAIANGSPGFFAEGVEVATVGSATGCGALITSGSPTVMAERP